MEFDLDLKYEVDSETASLPSTVEFFPDMAQFELDFEEEVDEPDITEWALKKIGTLQSRIEDIPKNKFNIYSANQIFNLANEVFGYNGWSTEILECNLLHEDFEQSYSAKFSVLLKVILKDGTSSEQYGFGEASNLPNKYMCYSKCKKQAVTDGTKNAIIAFKGVLLDDEVCRVKKEIV